MPFTKQGDFTTDVTKLPDVPSPTYTPTEIKQTIQQPSDELKATVNNIVDGLNGTKWVDEPKLGDGSVSRRTIQKGSVGVDEIDPSIMSQPTTAVGVQAKFDSVDAQLADIAINVSSYGAKGDGVTDDTVAIQNAVSASLQSGVPLYFPNKKYIVNSSIIIDYLSGYPQSSIFKAFGNTSGDAVDPKTNITFKGLNTCLFDVQLNDYAAEGYEFVGISFSQEEGSPEFQTSEAIRFTKVSTNYPRKFWFNDINAFGFKTLTRFLGDTTKPSTDNSNYYGPTHFRRVHTYKTLKGIEVNNCMLNLFTLEDTLFHGCSDGGGIDASNGIMYVSVKNTHFEGCEPAGIQTGSLHSKITLDGVSSESTGKNSGYGLIKTVDNSNVDLFINNQIYSFAGMPDEYKLSKGVHVSSNCPIKVSGESVVILTPETITPVVSNNASYNQTDAYSLILTPYKNLGYQYAGAKVFKSLGGSNANSGVSPDSGLLPDYLKKYYIGSTKLVNNLDESFTAPSDGFLYFTWLGKRGSANNGFSGADIYIDGVRVPISTGYRWIDWEGFYTLIIPIKANQVLTQATLTQYSMIYQSPAMVSFSSTAEKANICSNGFPRFNNKRVVVPANSTYSLVNIGEYTKSFAVKVTLTFTNGGEGIYQFIARGKGDNASRVLTTLVNSLGANITIADNGSPLNGSMYQKTITNSSANDINMDVQIEYLS